MKVLWFIGLKVTEIAAIVFVPHYLGRLVHSFTGFFCQHNAEVPTCAPMWLIGFASILLVVVAVLVITLIALFVAANWNLADALNRKWKDSRP